MLTDNLFRSAPSATNSSGGIPSKARPPSASTHNRRRVSDSGDHKRLLSQYKATSELSSSGAADAVIQTKLIHTQQKLFWQIKGSIDFHLFEHVDSSPCILELVPYDQSSERELEHIYMSKDIILPRIQSEVKRRMEQKQAALKPVRTKSSKGASGKLNSPGSSSFNESDALIEDDVTNEVIGEFILARTMVEPPDGVSTDPLKVRIKQTSSEMADASKLSILVKKPAGGRSDPAISRRRRPSVEAFDILLQSFNSDAESLSRASSSAAIFSAQSSQAIEKLEVIKSRPRAMSIDELRDLELKARRAPTPEKLTAKERWLKTIQSIHTQKNNPGSDDCTPSSTSPSPPARRSRAGRETFPKGTSPTPPSWTPATLSPAPGDRSPSPGGSRWNGGTRAMPLQHMSPVKRHSSPNSCALEKPPRPMWNASPARKRTDEPLGTMTPPIGRH